MDTTPLRHTGSTRRRIWSWAAFGTVGMVLTATWAAGVANAPATNVTDGSSTPVVAGAPTGATDRFASAIAAGPDANLRIDFVGLWGQIPNTATNPTVHYELFDVDLNGLASGTYFVEIGLLPSAPPAGFTALQVAWVIDNGTTCAAADLAAPDSTKVLFADNLDNSIVFSGLAHDTVHCIGVAATGTGLTSSTTGTFVRRAATGTWAGTMPTFVAIVNQHT